VSADEIAGMFAQPRTREDFGSFLEEIVGTVDEVVRTATQERRIAEAILRYEADGYATRRLEAALDTAPSEADVELLLRQYEQDVARLQALQQEIASINHDAPALADVDLFKNPDRVADAESAATEARERSKPLPLPPAGHTFATLTITDTFAVKAARAIVDKPGQQYNPLFLHGPQGSGKTSLLAAIANEFSARYANAPVAFVEGSNFASELIQALERNATESWRGRYRRARLFVVDNLDVLVDTERAQDELFHLFEDLRRSRAQLVFGSLKPPAALTGFENRLRTRLESGLVLELPALAPRAREAASDTRNQTPAAWVQSINVSEQSIREPMFDHFFLSREKIIWNWPYLEDCLFEEV
jgi:chromosomal replication initiation ATPase DnaA